jgi:hypothetical protein
MKQLLFTTFWLITLSCGWLLLMPNSNLTLAQVETCSSDGDLEPAASTYRTVTLPGFGIEVDIPSNYRTMRFQDGTVAILHPDDFEHIQCVTRIGRGGRGLYSERIQRVERDNSLSLREQAVRSVGYKVDESGNRIPTADEIIDYSQNGLSGYIVVTSNAERSGWSSAVFMGTTPNTNQVLRIFVSCDCAVEVEDLTELLSRTRALS